MKQDDYSSSNRRKFLIGAGSIAAGGSALFGTAATTTFNLNDRQVSANVVTDSSGAVALTDTEDPGDIINYTSDELEIDFAEGGASGVNVGSVVEVGDFADPINDSAFTITNQTTHEVDVEVEFEADGTNYSADSGGSTLKFAIEHVNVGTNGTSDKILTADDSLSPSSTTSVNYQAASDEGLAAGNKLDVAIHVDADNLNSSTNENLSGVLNITATQVESA